MVKPKVHSEKHYVQFSLSTLTAGNIDAKTPIAAVAIQDKNASGEVREGSDVKAIWVEYWLQTNDSSVGSFIFAIEKTMADSTGLEVGSIAALSSYTNKKNVFYYSQGLTPSNATQAIPVYKGWLKIPKSKQRFGLGDKIKLHFLAQTGSLAFCGGSTYKEYY